MNDSDIILVLQKIQLQVNALLDQFQKDLLSQKTIRNIIIDYFQITEDEFKSYGRKREINVMPRHFYYLFTRSLLGTSLQRLALETDKRGHATVLSGINKLCELIEGGNREVCSDFKCLKVIFEDAGYDTERTDKFIKEKV